MNTCRRMDFPDRAQYSFWGNVEFPSNDAAKLARDAKAAQLRKAGHRVRCSSLANQTRNYSGLGQPDGTTGNVYVVDDYGFDKLNRHED